MFKRDHNIIDLSPFDFLIFLTLIVRSKIALVFEFSIFIIHLIKLKMHGYYLLD